MRRYQAEKAFQLYSTIPGTGLVDKYINKLYKEELEELELFLKYVSKDIDKLFKKNCGETFVDTIKKDYVVQLNEIHQCRFTFYLENETDMSCEDESYTDIRIQFKTFEKSTWVDQFVIEGDGKYKGISIEEFRDWLLLLFYIIDKQSSNAKFKPFKTDNEMIYEGVYTENDDDIIKMVDLSSISKDPEA